MAQPACMMCFDTGWVLDSNGAGMVEPKSLEFIQCFHPECRSSGATIASLNFKGVEFHRVSRHPRDGWVMSLGDARLAP